MDQAKAVAQKFVSFVNRSPSPFHATSECCAMLAASGFRQLEERESWKLEPLGKYFLTRNDSTVVAFALGGAWKPGNGFSMIATHTDSPCFRIKPNSKITSGEYLQVGVMCYGGGIWRTWFDRDLSIAGKVIYKAEASEKDGSRIKQKLVRIRRPILSIPSLAIHLDRGSNDSFTLNKETHLLPVLATKHIEECLTGKTSPTVQQEKDKSESPVKAKCGSHHGVLLKALADEANISSDQIIDFDLYLYDTQPASIGGLFEEFIYGARQDNLTSTFCAMSGLIESCASGSGSLSKEPNIRLVASFDNEEIGSETAQGAMSSITEWILRRISASGPDGRGGSSTPFEEAIAKSYLISMDNCHALHPNYEGKYEKQNAPKLHKGPAVKINANQRYATSALTHAILTEIATEANVPLQEFVVRNDSACGSTVGPIMAAKLGLNTIDIGLPSLAMHSIREMACVSGIEQGTKLCGKFFENFAATLQRIDFEALRVEDE